MWMDYGYGMMALYKSDWDIAGGNYLCTRGFQFFFLT